MHRGSFLFLIVNHAGTGPLPVWARLAAFHRTDCERGGIVGKVVAFAFCLLFLFMTMDAVAQTSVEKGLKDLREENYEEALVEFMKARKQEPTSSRIAYYLGVTYKHMEQYDEAVPYLRDAVTFAPRIKEALVELTDALYQLDNLDEAKKWLDVAEKESLSSGRLEFLKGLIFLKEAKNLEAVAAFEKAKEMDTTLTQAAEFHIASAYVKQGKLEEARERFGVAVTVDPTSDIGMYARDYGKALAEKMERERPWRFNIGLGYKYDTNLVTKPTSGPVADSITGEKDSALNATLRGTYVAPFSFNGPFMFSASYQAYVDEYSHETNDAVNQSIMLAPGYNFSRVSLRLPVLYGYTWLDGQRYMELVGIIPTVEIMANADNALELSFGYQYKNFLQELGADINDAEEDRDANNSSVSVGWTYLTGKQGVLNARYSYSQEHSDGINWDYRDDRLGLSAIYPLFTEALKIQLSGEVDKVRYRNVHTVFGKKRKDDLVTAVVGLSYMLYKDTEISARLTYTRNASNIPDFYGYRRKVYFVGMEYGF